LKVTCEFCNRELNPKGHGVYKQVMGWIQPGKTSGLKLPTGGVGWAHGNCIDLEHRKRSGTFKQEESLF